jgi:hypothetical protein
MPAARIAARFSSFETRSLAQRGLLQVDLIHRPAVAECPVFARRRRLEST